MPLNDLANPNGKKVQNNWYLANLYLQVFPAEGKQTADVEFMIDNAVCWDGALTCDPVADPEAPKKSLANDPIRNAKPPADKPRPAEPKADAPKP